MNSLPNVFHEKFVLVYEGSGGRRSVELDLVIDLDAIREKLGKKAAMNGGGVSRDGAIAVRRLTFPMPTPASLGSTPKRGDA